MEVINHLNHQFQEAMDRSLIVRISLVDKIKVGWPISHNSNIHEKGGQAKTEIQEALCIPQEKRAPKN
jgi:hypothetical protein